VPFRRPSRRIEDRGEDCAAVLLTLILIVLPGLWLAVAALTVAACRAASRADRAATDGQGDRYAGGPPALSLSAGAGHGFATSHGV
jgi:hypothetical protein